MAYGMVIDLKKCVGCHACHVSCKAANGTPPGVTRARVVREDKGKYPDVKRTIVPMLCMQCEKPPCVAQCPVGATKKDDDGVVSMDLEKCIGCKACIAACPYEARYFIENNKGYFGDNLNPFETSAYVEARVGAVDKCDFCKGNGRLERGEQPACVSACIVGARVFGNLEDLQDLIKSRNGFQLLPEKGTNPSVYYLPAE
ncbi:MAG: 4Fe-4S dicluster domain-containing protein [Raoultibacter sp.]